MRVVIEILHFVCWSIFWGKHQKKLTMVNAFPVLWDGSMDKSVMEKYVYVALLIQKQESQLLCSLKLSHHPKVKMHLDLRKQQSILFKGTTLNLLLRSCFFVRQCFSELQKIFWVDQIISSWLPLGIICLVF